MVENSMAKHKKTQYQIGYYLATIITKHNDANVMPNSDQIYSVSKTIHTILNHHIVLKVDLMTDTLQTKYTKKIKNTRT
jgi:hypothetical protein